MTETTTGRTTRAERLAMPLAREVVHDLAVEHGACIRPVQLRRTNLDTGDVEQVLVPCGHTLASVCPSCAERARALRAVQCREGWHLETEPVMDPDPATGDQRWWIEQRAEAQRMRDQADAAGEDAGDLDELLTEVDGEITNAGMRGKVLPARPARRHRSGRPCSSPSLALVMGGCVRMARPPTRLPTTRISTSRCAARCPGPSCAASSPPPITRCGGRTPPMSGSMASSCRSGTRTLATTLTRPPGKSFPPGMTPWTPSAPRTSHGMWPGSGSGSTPKVCCPARKTRRGASAT